MSDDASNATSDAAHDIDPGGSFPMNDETGTLELAEPQVSTDLVVSGTLSAALVFAPGGVESILEKLEKEVRGVRTDISTPAGRKAIASLAHKVARSKTALDEMGKQLTDQWRLQAEKVHAERRIIVARLDALKDEVRKPLTDWENAEKARVQAHEDALAAMAALATFFGEATLEELDVRVEALRELAGRSWQEFTARATDAGEEVLGRLQKIRADVVRREEERAELARLRAEAEERERQEAARRQAEREAQIAAEAAARAKQEAEAEAERQRVAAEERAQAEQLRLQREKEEAEQRAARAEREAAERAAQAERDRVAAQERAGRAREEAVQAERRRAAQEQADAEAEAARRAANVAHRKRINHAALAAIVACGASDEIGMAIITAIAQGKVPHVAIAY